MRPSEVPDLAQVPDLNEAPIPRGADGVPAFRAPWEAQAFAMAVTLRQRGLFTWGEWARALGDEIRRSEAAGGCRDGSDYYERWLAALEAIVAEKQVASVHDLARRAAAWDRAAHATPHGEPILLANDPLAGR